jgi:hypothetical protein
MGLKGTSKQMQIRLLDLKIIVKEKSYFEEGSRCSNSFCLAIKVSTAKKEEFFGKIPISRFFHQSKSMLEQRYELAIGPILNLFFTYQLVFPRFLAASSTFQLGFNE